MHLCGGNLPRRVAQLSEPKTSQEMRGGFCDEMDRLKRIAAGFFALLRDHHGLASL